MPGNDRFTKVLLHCDGTDTSTTFTDSNFGGSAHTWTAAGNAQIDTAIFKFGGAAGLFDGTGDYVQASDSADFTLGSGDFTIDVWFNRAGGDGAARRIAGQSDSSSTATTISFLMGLTAGNVAAGIVYNGSTQNTVLGTTTFTSTGWHHLAFVRTGNTLKLFVDGTQEGGDVAFSSTVNDSTNKLGFGVVGETTTNSWNGSLDEFRISVGIARWTANFATPLAPYDTSEGFSVNYPDLLYRGPHRMVPY